VQDRLLSQPELRRSADYAEGTIIGGNYRIERKLGGGGMGTVYQCTDLAMRRSVAVKFLHPHLVTSDKWLLRFQQEARAVGRLEHPNIIGVHAFSRQGDTPFIVMDFVQGTSLDAILQKEGTLSIERAIKIMSQVADALVHAHKAGVIHRDLKPSNILILNETDDAVRILDFGIAKLEDDGEGLNGPKLTQTGEVFGSPAYMSPEQSMGRNIDGRSDQYSFGCVLYECLTGSVPFVGASLVEVMMKQTGEKPQSLAEASLGKRFPGYMEAAVAKTLEKDPAHRFESMEAVKEALTGKVPVASAKPKQVGQAKREGSQWALLAVAGLLIVGLVLFMLRMLFAPIQVPTQAGNSIHQVPDINLTKDNDKLREEEKGERYAAEILSKWVEQNHNATSFVASKLPGQHDTATQLSDGSLRLLRGMPNLNSIDVSWCEGVKDAGIREIAACHPRIEHLNVSQSGISRAALPTVATLPLKSLELCGAQINNDDLNHLLPLKRLEYLNLSDCQFLDARAAEIIGKMTSLKHLSLDKNHMGGGVRFLTGLTKLDILDLDDFHVRNEDIHSISMIPSITQLSMSKGEFDNEALQDLARLHKLTYLSMDNCHLIGSPTGALQPLERLPLIQVRLSEAAVSDADAECLANIPTLESVCASRTNITARGITALSKLKHVKHLEISTKLLGTAELKEFERLHPNCEVKDFPDDPRADQSLNQEVSSHL
jgi:serine/threonine protein kinase